MFVLASASPRRSKLLSDAGFDFEIFPSLAQEISDGREPENVALENAVLKAEDVYRIKKLPTLGADTVVSIDGRILGKPKNAEENAAFLHLLSGRTHKVTTGYCLIKDGKRYYGTDTALVTFEKLSEPLIDSYVMSGNGLDKAGGYGIQDGFRLVKSISGSYTCVVGLPMEVVGKLIKEVL